MGDKCMQQVRDILIYVPIYRYMYTIICILEVPIFFKMSDKIYIDISIQYGIEMDTCIHLQSQSKTWVRFPPKGIFFLSLFSLLELERICVLLTSFYESNPNIITVPKIYRYFEILNPEYRCFDILILRLDVSIILHRNFTFDKIGISILE